MMRLLKRSPDGEIDLRSFDDDNVPQYAILSHTWKDGQEVTYNELKTSAGKQKTGYAKIQFCIDQAACDGLEYSWVDTCCIDKSDNVELTTAINSMFRWYQRAAKCYVYLSDVQLPDEIADHSTCRIAWSETFRRSRWFTRGWTLQELLAPPIVEFFSNNCRRLGSKISLEQEIHQITKVPIEALQGQRLSEFSVDERRKWVARRKTTVKEDIVYCILGICGVFLPLIYGEGEKYATLRLTDEIAKRQGGQGSRSVQDLAVSSPLPFPRNELFTGREDQLRHLEQSLLLPNTHRRMAIHGLGGCGKSALALEFAYRAMIRDNRREVFWVPAITQDGLELAYREIGVRLRVPGMADDNEDIKRLVKEALSSDSAQDWLMIVDNADDPEVLLGRASTDSDSTRLYDYFPRNDRGRILFTTRSRKAAVQLTQNGILDLDSMSKSEAKQLLERQLVNQAMLNDEKSINDLLESLTYLPLAIVQAAAFINSNDVSLAEYISLFQELGTQAEIFSESFEDNSRHREMDNTIAKTWHISFSQMRKQDPLAADYLSFMACIDRMNIPLSLLPPRSSLQQTKAIGTLKGYAFITERQQASQEPGSERLFDMHRLVHMALAWWLESQSEQSEWTAKAAARLEELIPYGGHAMKEVWTAYLSHATHIAETNGILDDTSKGSLLARVARCQYSLGRYSMAETLERQALSLRQQILGPEHPSTLMSMNDLALVLNRQGKYEEAESMHRQTLALREKILGPEHPDTLMSMNNLALVLNRQGKYEEAESIHRQTLALCEKVLGPEHPDTLMSMNNLALLLDNQGKYEEAESMHRQTLALYEKVLGPEHPDTLMSMNNLALLLDNQCKYEEAESMHRHTLALCEKVLGPEHPDTLMSMNNLALVLNRQGKYEEAESMHRQTLALCEKVLGPEHPDTLTSMSNFALVGNNLGKYKEAESMHRQALALREKVLGPEHPDTLMTMNNLATVLDKQGKYEEAESMHRQTLALREKILGPEHPYTLATVNNLAAMLKSQGILDEAESLFWRALKGREKAFGTKHTSIITTIHGLGSLYRQQERLEEALQIYMQALQGLAQASKPDRLSISQEIRRLGLDFKRKGKLDDATAIEASLSQMLKSLGDLEEAKAVKKNPTSGTVKNKSDVSVHDSGYGSASRHITSTALSEPGAKDDEEMSHIAVANTHELHEIWETRSLVSQDDDIGSQISTDSTKAGITGQTFIAIFLAEEPRFKALCDTVLARIEKARFIENVRRLLRFFHLNLLKEGKSEGELVVARLLRRRNARQNICRQLLVRVQAEQDLLEQDLLEQDGLYALEPLMAEKLVVEKYVEDWLTDSARSRSEATDTEGVNEHPMSSYIGEAFHVHDVGEASEESDSDDGPTESETLHTFQFTSELKRFLRDSTSFRSLLQDFGLWLLPIDVQQVLSSTSRKHIWLSSEQDLSLVNQAKAWVEDKTNVKWNWWPLEPRKRTLRNGESRLFWRCQCGKQLWLEISANHEELIRVLLEVLDDTPSKPHACGARRLRLPRTQDLISAIRAVTSASPPVLTSKAASRYAPADSSIPQTSSHPSSSNTIATQSSPSRQQLRSHVLSNAQMATPETQVRSYILFGVRGGYRAISPAQVPVYDWSTDLSLFRDLKTCYQAQRGRLRLWFSVWDLEHCAVAKFNRLSVKRMVHESRELPDRQEYEYSPRAGHREAKNPPVSAHWFKVLYYSCHQPCTNWIPHECSSLPSRTEALDRFPKRAKCFRLDETSPVWGLEAVFVVSVFRVLCYHFVLVVGPFAFFSWWVAMHPGDLQNASVPATLACGALSLLWMISGILTTNGSD